MYEFDFSTLSPTEFEELACDLLNAKEKEEGSSIRFRTFKEGKDRGIDFLSITENDQYNMVGQAKHYYRSGFPPLLKNIKSKEKAKIARLGPHRYILVTSVDLSVGQVIEPYVKSLGDIYGEKDLNRLLNTFPETLDRYLKLWCSSLSILRKLEANAAMGTAETFLHKQIKNKLPRYVQTEAFNDARRILEEKNILVITGEPGVGKTSLAEMLLFGCIKDNYKLCQIDSDITEIRKLLIDDNTKQVFYFDDFLGHTRKEIQKASEAECSLLNIIQLIKSSANKKLILTTRTLILNKASGQSEKFSRLHKKIGDFELRLSVLTKEQRFAILENHVKESTLPEELKDILRQDKIKSFIANHQNFYPRSVEFITSSEYIDNANPSCFEKFVTLKFNRPDQIWRHAYENQIDDIDRILLNTLWSFEYEPNRKDLEEAFHSRLHYELQRNNLTNLFNAFNKSYRRLSGAFIKEGWGNAVELINHSFKDFLDGYLEGDQYEFDRIEESAKYIDQLYRRVHDIFQRGDLHAMTLFLQNRLANETESLLGNSGDSDKLSLALLIMKYCKCDKSCSIVIDLLKQIKDWTNFAPSAEALALETVLKASDACTKKVVEAVGVQIAIPILLETFDFQYIDDCVSFFAKYYNLDITVFFRDGQPVNMWGDFETIVSATYHNYEPANVEGKSEDEINQVIDDYIEFRRREWEAWSLGKSFCPANTV